MIFIEQNPNKTTAVFALVFITGVFVIWGWIKINPLSSAQSQPDDQYWAMLAGATQNTANQVKDSVETGGAELNNLQNEFERQAQADALLQATKEYIESTSTPTSTSQ